MPPLEDHSHDLPHADIVEEMPDTDRDPTPEEMAEELGCQVDELADVLAEKIAAVGKAAEEFAARFKKPVLNRKQRRDMKHGRRGAAQTFSDSRRRR